MQNKYKTMFGQNALMIEETLRAINEVGTPVKNELGIKANQGVGKAKKTYSKGQETKGTGAKKKKKQQKVKKNNEDAQREIQYAKCEAKHHQTQSIQQNEVARLKDAIILAEIIGGPRCKTRRGRQTRRGYGN